MVRRRAAGLHASAATAEPDALLGTGMGSTILHHLFSRWRIEYLIAVLRGPPERTRIIATAMPRDGERIVRWLAPCLIRRHRQPGRIVQEHEPGGPALQA